ncbi:MAG TPA: ATP-dependent helicase [Phycisphaerae bacterium]|nr:ATP-dependent helicase [Phycisphaerae bacterium]HRY69071.1 ATP-dependent helicase [Phycisphaerae bacterium]HSA25954.1 ATP-dependent helicase [Phycisphaerae bacterium]
MSETELSGEQRAAVEATESQVLVVAGAGSGKTRVLTHRVAHLVDTLGIEPDRVLVLTYTRKAAAEMRARLIGMLDADRLEGMFIGTIHGWCLKILNEHGFRIGYRRGVPLTVHRENERSDLVQGVATDLGYLRNGKWRQQLSMARCLAAVDGHGAIDSTELATLVVECGARRMACNAIDYAHMISECRRLLDMGGIRDTLRLEHVVVDEVQDVNADQDRLLRRLAPPAHYYAVGDRRQAIYGFRGARPDLMDTRPGLTVYQLADNYRSVARIVTAANQLMDASGDQLATHMAAVRAQFETLGTIDSMNEMVAK